MKIGLVRHFKVNNPSSRLITSNEFQEWVKQYDIAEIIKQDTFLGETIWDKCFSSDLPRATKTAETIYRGEIIKTELLREVPISPIIKTNFKIPCSLWAFLGRLAWLTSHKSQTEKRSETKKRIQDFVASILKLNESNILIVSHGFFMISLQEELINNGFKGKKVRKAKNGTLYIYEK